MTVEETAQKIVQVLNLLAADRFTGQVAVDINFINGGIAESKVISSQSLTSIKTRPASGSDSVLRSIRGESPR